MIFEKYLQLTGYDLDRASRALKKVQSMSKDEFNYWHSKKKWEIAKYHYKNNKYYKRKVGNFFPEKWCDLPVMQKSDFQVSFDKILSNGYTKANTYVANTSGSSGHPFFFAKNKEAHAMDWALIKNRNSWHNLQLNSKQARFYGISYEILPYIKEKIKDLIMNRIRFPVFDLSDNILESYLNKFERKEFILIYGYTNSLLIFAKYLLKKNIILSKICPTLTHCISTAEVLTDYDKEILKLAFGVPILNEYGASEVGLLASESIDSEWLLCEEILFYEIIGNDGVVVDGREGNIVVTDLDNLAMPFIRYDTGDIGIINKSINDYEINTKNSIRCF